VVRGTGRRDAAQSPITHPEKPVNGPGGLVPAGCLPNLADAKHAKLSAPANRTAKQCAFVVLLRLSAPINFRNITLRLKTIISAPRTPLINEFYEIPTAAWRGATPQIAPKTVKTGCTCEAVGRRFR
jgi:hypothetical protein